MKSAIVVAVVILVAAAGFLTYRHYHKTTPTTTGDPTIKLAPATPEEKQETEEHKDDIVKDQQQPTPPPDTKKSVTPVITLANKTEVRAYVSGVFEDSGTCTATATQGSKTVTKSSAGFGNVSTTQCTPLTWDTPLGAGTWQVIVRYNSPTASGQSASTEVN